MFKLSTVGVFLYFFYPILLISISLYVSLTKETTAESYFFGDRKIHWSVLGLSLIIPSIFGPYLFGFTSAGSFSGFPLVYALISVVMLAVLGWFLAPIYFKTKVNTLPEFFEKRFNKACRFYVSGLYIFLNIVLRLLMILIAGNVFIKMITGVDPYFSILFFLVVSSIFLIIGGLQAEIYVSIVQVLLIGIVLISFAIWIINQGSTVPSASNKISLLSYSGNGVGPKFTWSEMAFGLPIIGFWFWCADQFVIQKVASTSNVNSVRKASLVSAFLQVIPILIFLAPGVIAAVLFPNILSEELLPALFSEGFLPRSLKGGLIIAVAAALIASFASIFNSTTVLITSDFFLTFKPNTSDRKLVLVGRLTTLFLLFCAVLLVPISQSLDFAFCIKLFSAFSYFASLVAAVFLIGLVNSKIKAASALITLSIGTVIISLRVVNEMFFDGLTFDNPLLKWFLQSGFLEFSVFVFLSAIIFQFVFNKIEWIRLIVNSFKRVFLKVKNKSGLHKKVLFVLPALIVAIKTVGSYLT